MRLKELLMTLRDAEITNLAIFDDSDYIGTAPAPSILLKPYFDREVRGIQILDKPKAGSLDANLVVGLSADKEEENDISKG